MNVEGARMYAACQALRQCLLQLGVSIDGGKDSLTMAAKVHSIVYFIENRHILNIILLYSVHK